MEATTNIIVQYIVVGIVLAAISIWLILKLIKLHKKGGAGACCGCSLAESCNKKELKKEPKQDKRH